MREKFVKVWTNCEYLIENFKSLKIFFESFKENANKNLEKLNENYYISLLSILLLAEAWVVPHPLQIFRGFGGGGRSFPTSPWSRYCYWLCVFSICPISLAQFQAKSLLNLICVLLIICICVDLLCMYSYLYTSIQ